jgi:hypothetical protein
MTTCTYCHTSLPRRPRCRHGQKPVNCGTTQCLTEHLCDHAAVCPTWKPQTRIGMILLRAAQRLVVRGGIVLTTEAGPDTRSAVEDVIADVRYGKLLTTNAEEVAETQPTASGGGGRKPNQKRKPHRKRGARGKAKAAANGHRRSDRGRKRDDQRPRVSDAEDGPGARAAATGRPGPGPERKPDAGRRSAARLALGRGWMDG